MRASLIPSITPRAAAEAPSVPVRNVGRTDVVTSWPVSEKKLAAPTAPTPDVNQRPSGAAATAFSQPSPLLVISRPHDRQLQNQPLALVTAATLLLKHRHRRLLGVAGTHRAGPIRCAPPQPD